MSYTALCKKWERESKRKEKERRLERARQKERELKFADELFIARMRWEKKEQELAEKKQEERINLKNQILADLQGNNKFQYNQFLILWDVITNNYSQIQSDIQKEKINKSDITQVFEFIQSYSNELINEYWKECLLT